MEPMIERCAGIDVHQAHDGGRRSGCRRRAGAAVTTQTFGDDDGDLLALARLVAGVRGHARGDGEHGGLLAAAVLPVGGRFTLVLVNMQHLKHVPGRKTDVRDSEWLAQLLECGLLRGSLVPPAPIRDLRDLTRYRKRQIEDRAQEVNRLYRLLEDAGLKLASVLTDVMGVSGRAMVDALLQGQTRPARSPTWRAGGCGGNSRPCARRCRAASAPHHAFLVTQILAKVDFLEEAIETADRGNRRQLRPFEAALARLMTIPGVARRNATTLLVETGGDMGRFPDRRASV